MQPLSITELFGVGKVTANKIHSLNINNCADLQKLSISDMVQYFGSFGVKLYQQCRGIDNRIVEPNQIRKSLSVETKFIIDKEDMEK